jgi:hypothetical protein
MRPGDAAIYVWGWIPGYLDAYLPPAPSPLYALGFFTPQGLDHDMQSIVANHQRLWLFDYQVDQFDVRNLAGTWLRPKAALVYEEWPGAGYGHVALFALTPTPSQSNQALTAQFANGLTLQTTQLQTTLTPGDSLALALTWTPTRPITERYTIFLHGLAPDGSLAFGRDSEPDNGLTPFPNLTPNLPHSELRGLLIPPQTPPGSYTLQLGLYNTLTGQPDPTTLTLGTLTIP